MVVLGRNTRPEQQLQSFQFDEVTFSLSDKGDVEVNERVKNAWKKYGFFIVKGVFDAATVEALESCIKSSIFQEQLLPRVDQVGKKLNFVLWNNVDDGLCGAISTCDKVVSPFEELLGGEVYHYHTKLVMKDPHGAGAFNWHQDYGYWYRNGCLSPEMGTFWMPLDYVDAQNGCLKVIPGSHNLGRIDHININNQVTADPERLEVILDKYGFVDVVMASGDGLYFHANLLHSSDQNWSSKRRWAFLSSYNPKWNDPVYKHHHPNFTPLRKIRNEDVSQYQSIVGTNFCFLKEGEDLSLTSGYGLAHRVKRHEMEDTATN